jgi:hypothetical protein
MSSLLPFFATAPVPTFLSSMVTPLTTFVVEAFSAGFLVSFWPLVGPCSIGLANWTFFLDSGVSAPASTALPSLAFSFFCCFLESLGSSDFAGKLLVHVRQ